MYEPISIFPSSWNSVGPGFSLLGKSGTRLPIGQTNVTCKARDKSGNMAKCNFEVDVQGNQL